MQLYLFIYFQLSGAKKKVNKKEKWSFNMKMIVYKISISTIFKSKHRLILSVEHYFAIR